jgi:hypothetical protein
MAVSVARRPASRVGVSSVRSRPRLWYRLASGLRLDLFAILFALGTLHHEAEFVREQYQVGRVVEYMERWRPVVPSVGWPSEVGVSLHAANVAVSLLIIVLRRRRELLSLLAVTFLLSQVASPHRVASHSGLMAAALLVIVTLAIGEWLQRFARRKHLDPERGVWYSWTLFGLAVVCCLTYHFAFFYKLNPSWLSSGSAAPSFLIRPLAPILEPLGVPSDLYRPVLAAVAIYGTLIVELVLPLLLLLPRTRVLGCLVGLVFHLPMLVQGVLDFPILILACYPAFLSVTQARELVRRCLARPRAAHLALVVALGAYGGWVLLGQGSTFKGLFGNYGPGVELFVLRFDAALGCANLLLLLHVAFTLGAWLRRTRPDLATRSGAAARDLRPEPSPAGRAAGAGGSIPTALAVSSVILVTATFFYLNLARFFGLPAAGAMIMYSSIDQDRGSHLLMPRVSLVHSFSFASIVHLDVQGVETREAREFRVFLEELAEQDRPYRLNLNFLRYHLSRICGSAPGGTVGLGLEIDRVGRVDIANACANPSMLWYVPMPVVSECSPSCAATLRDWARGRLPAD